MSRLKLSNGAVYDIEDYAAPNSFSIRLNAMTASEVLETLTEENLSEIQFLTDKGAVTGTYGNKLLTGYTDNGGALAVSINDADLCRYGLVLDADGRILFVSAQRYAQEGAVIVDELPDGAITDYRYMDGKYVYDPLPAPEPVTEPTAWDQLAAAYSEGVQSA